MASVKVLISLAWLAAPMASACSLTPVAGVGQDLPDGAALNRGLLDAAILARVNLARCEAGVGALAPAPGLAQAAAAQGQWMAAGKRLTHQGGPPGLATLTARISAGMDSFSVGAENIATASPYRLDGVRVTRGKGACSFLGPGGQPIARQSYASLAEEVVGLWLGSPAHRRNILDPRFRWTGAGAGFDRSGAMCGTFYLAELFAG